MTHPPAPPGCRVLHFELLAIGPGSGHLSAHATGAGRDGLTLGGGKGTRRCQARPCRVLGPHGSGTPNSRLVASEKKQQAAPHPGGVGHVLRWRAGPSRPSCLSIAILQKLYELRSRQLHALPLLSLWSWKAIEGRRVKKKKRNSASGVARGGPDTTLGLKPDTRRGYGVAARPRTLPPALPATRSGNARSGSPTTTPPC